MPLFDALLLAQSEDGLKKANDAIDTIDKLGKAGPITLALVVAIAAVVFAVYMLRKVWQLREEHAIELKNREQAAKTDADKRLSEVLAVEKERRETEKQMLREMIERGHEATDALEGNNKAVEAFKLALDGFTRRLDEMDRNLDKRFDELLRAVGQRS
jgi:low affinity Fe/Cu permease